MALLLQSRPKKTSQFNLGSVQPAPPVILHDRLDLFQDPVDEPSRHNDSQPVVEEDVGSAGAVDRARRSTDRVQRPGYVCDLIVTCNLALQGRHEPITNAVRFDVGIVGADEVALYNAIRHASSRKGTDGDG